MYESLKHTGGAPKPGPQNQTKLLAEVFPVLQAWQEVGRGSLWTGSFNHEARVYPPQLRSRIETQLPWQKNHPASLTLGDRFVVKGLYYNMQCSTVVYREWWFGDFVHIFLLPSEWTLGKCMPWRSWMCVPLQNVSWHWKGQQSDHINCNPTRGKQQFYRQFCYTQVIFHKVASQPAPL